MADSIAIRAMRREDLEALLDIDSRSSGRSRAEYLRCKLELALTAGQKMVLFLVAERAGQVVGFLTGQVCLGEYGVPECMATVDTVGVHPEARGKGVGGLLVEAFAAQAREAGVEYVRTMVNWHQGDLLGFFRASGFEPGSSIVLEKKL